MSVIADNTTVITPPSPQRIVTSCSQCGHTDVNYRIDRLSKQLDNLELSVSTDIKTILHILKHRHGNEFLATEVNIAVIDNYYFRTWRSLKTAPIIREFQFRPDGCRLRPSPIKKTSSIPTSEHLPRPTLAVKFRFGKKKKREKTFSIAVIRFSNRIIIVSVRAGRQPQFVSFSVKVLLFF